MVTAIDYSVWALCQREVRVGGSLDSDQIGGVLGRRDRLITRAERLASERGEAVVWFP